MNNIDNYVRLYSYLVKYSSEDEAYIARSIELGIRAHGDTQEEAIAEIKEATRVHLLMLSEDGDEIPEPFFPTAEVAMSMTGYAYALKFGYL
jgi:predicted RNase H-like HicB family nuclease